MKKLSIVAIVLASLAIAGEIFIYATPKEDSDEVQTRAIMHDYRVYAPVIPDTMTFCGETVPLETYYVREALDNELIINMYRQSSTVLYFKRANRYFPIIEPILKKHNIPDDMKYLCVIESGLTNATSPAKAQGFWQFIPSTGKKYGLTIDDEIDMRNDLEASTEAACKYLCVRSTTVSTAGRQRRLPITVVRTALPAAWRARAPTSITTSVSTAKRAGMSTVSWP